jgi:biotin synthesis protein bioC
MSDNRFVVFGAGYIGEKAIQYIGKDKISFFIDNNLNKQGTLFHGFKVYAVKDVLDIVNRYTVIVAVDEGKSIEIMKQLDAYNIKNYKSLCEAYMEEKQEQIETEVCYSKVYEKAIEWVECNTVQNKGIINNSDVKKPYPEVTGYYIPTLLRFGYQDLACQYAKWLCGIQKPDGSWYDTDDEKPYVFDTAQILKGLLAVRDVYRDVDDNIRKACDWLTSHIDGEGRFHAVDEKCFAGRNKCSELIHIYGLEPLQRAGKILKEKKYIEDANKSIHYYVNNRREEILNFSLLSHFYAYVMEGLVDIGESEIAREAMKKIAILQRESGAVPAYKDCSWVCSTGLFQLAIVWYKLGENERGNRAFEYACKLQNKTGGWFGSYLVKENPKENNTYFPMSEISWANKYFLDAYYLRNRF